MGKTGRADRACSAGCVRPTSNPAARAARAAPTPQTSFESVASRHEISLVELALIVRISGIRDLLIIAENIRRGELARVRAAVVSVETNHFQARANPH